MILKTPCRAMEALNEKLNNTSHVVVYTEDYGYEQSYWQDYGYNTEIRGGVSFFIKETGRGQHVFTYSGSSCPQGEFIAQPGVRRMPTTSAIWGRSQHALAIAR
jgi:hypothetical protein